MLDLFRRNTSLLISRHSFCQAERWLEIFTAASKGCGTELRKWQNGRRRMQLIFSCLAGSSGIWLWWEKSPLPTANSKSAVLLRLGFHLAHLQWAAGMLLFFCSTLGSDGLALPSVVSSHAWGNLRQSLRGLSVEFAKLSDKAAQQVQPSVFPTHHLLSCPKLALGNKCCFVNVLRGAVKRTMLWKNWIFSWICCSLTEWVNETFFLLLLKWHLFQKQLNVKVPYAPQLSFTMWVSLLPCLRSEVSNSF